MSLYRSRRDVHTVVMSNSQSIDSLGQIKDLVAQCTPFGAPFLYYLPSLLTLPEFKQLNSDKLIIFVKQAVLYEQKPIVHDALRVLNNLVDPNDGRLLTPTPAHYYNNYSFSWSELGNKTDIMSVITHVLNKTIFQLSLGS